MEVLETSITLDDLDLMAAVLEGFAESLDEADDDRAAISELTEKLADLTDRICSLSEYRTGNDWPGSTPIVLSCAADAIGKNQ